MADTVASVTETVGRAVARGAASLPDSDTPRLDAELLLASVLGTDRARLVLDRDVALPADSLARFDALIARRAAHEPVAYILGRRGFRHLDLAVDARALIPRPETELLVEVALGLPEGASVLDVGCGSGAIALAVKHERRDLDVRGVDTSRDAIALARFNAADLSLDVRFSVGDLLTNVCSVDAVLANLPYVSDGYPLPADIAGFEPAGALFAGPDGLDVIRRLVAQLRQLAVAPSVVALELAPAQAAEVAALLRAAGLESIDVLEDLAGLERVAVARP